MKKLICLLLAVFMCIGIALAAASCGEEDKPTESSTSESTAATEASSATEKEETSATEASSATEKEETSASEASSETEASSATEASESESQTESETTPPTTDFVIPSQYADVDFAGKTFNIIYRYQTAEDTPSGWGQVFDLYIDEENPDDALSAAVQLRAAYMQQKWNCVVVGTGAIQATTDMANAVDSGDSTYDMIIANASPLSYANGKYYNILPMLDQSLTCWDTAVLRDLTIGNKLYGITGNCSTSDDDYTWTLFFNKALLDENNLEYPYQLVREGKWTIDKFLEYSRACAKDIDGDNTVSNQNGKDIFGFVTHGEHAPAVWIGSGVRFAGPVQADGKSVTTFNALGYEADVYAKLLEIMWDSATGYANKQVNMGVPEGLRTVFAEGRAAFYGEVLQNIGNSYQTGCLKDVEGLSFGIVPQPKWSEEQSSYYHYVNTQASFIAVPTTSNYAIMTNFLNIYGFMSEQTIQATFISNASTAWVSDADVAEMMTIIFQTRIWDAGYWFDQAAIHSNLLSDLGNNKNRYASRVKSGTTALQSVLDNAFTKVTALTV